MLNMCEMVCYKIYNLHINSVQFKRLFSELIRFHMSVIANSGHCGVRKELIDLKTVSGS